MEDTDLQRGVSSKQTRIRHRVHNRDVEHTDRYQTLFKIIEPFVKSRVVNGYKFVINSVKYLDLYVLRRYYSVKSDNVDASAGYYEFRSMSRTRGYTTEEKIWNRLAIDDEKLGKNSNTSVLSRHVAIACHIIEAQISIEGCQMIFSKFNEYYRSITNGTDYAWFFLFAEAMRDVKPIYTGDESLYKLLQKDLSFRLEGIVGDIISLTGLFKTELARVLQSSVIDIVLAVEWIIGLNVDDIVVPKKIFEQSDNEKMRRKLVYNFQGTEEITKEYASERMGSLPNSELVSIADNISEILFNIVLNNMMIDFATIGDHVQSVITSFIQNNGRLIEKSGTIQEYTRQISESHSKSVEIKRGFSNLFVSILGAIDYRIFLKFFFRLATFWTVRYGIINERDYVISLNKNEDHRTVEETSKRVFEYTDLDKESEMILATCGKIFDIHSALYGTDFANKINTYTRYGAMFDFTKIQVTLEQIEMLASLNIAVTDKNTKKRRSDISVEISKEQKRQPIEELSFDVSDVGIEVFSTEQEQNIAMEPEINIGQPIHQNIVPPAGNVVPLSSGTKLPEKSIENVQYIYQNIARTSPNLLAIDRDTQFLYKAMAPYVIYKKIDAKKLFKISNKIDLFVFRTFDSEYTGKPKPRVSFYKLVWGRKLMVTTKKNVIDGLYVGSKVEDDDQRLREFAIWCHLVVQHVMIIGFIELEQRLVEHVNKISTGNDQSWFATLCNAIETIVPIFIPDESLVLSSEASIAKTIEYLTERDSDSRRMISDKLLEIMRLDFRVTSAIVEFLINVAYDVPVFDIAQKKLGGSNGLDVRRLMVYKMTGNPNVNTLSYLDSIQMIQYFSVHPDERQRAVYDEMVVRISKYFVSTLYVDHRVISYVPIDIYATIGVDFWERFKISNAVLQKFVSTSVQLKSKIESYSVEKDGISNFIFKEVENVDLQKFASAGYTRQLFINSKYDAKEGGHFLLKKHEQNEYIHVPIYHVIKQWTSKNNWNRMKSRIDFHEKDVSVLALAITVAKLIEIESAIYGKDFLKDFDDVAENTDVWSNSKVRERFNDILLK